MFNRISSCVRRSVFVCASPSPLSFTVSLRCWRQSEVAGGGLPPWDACEVAAKRLRTGSALLIKWKKVPRTEKLLNDALGRGERREVCVCVASSDTLLHHQAVGLK